MLQERSQPTLLDICRAAGCSKAVASTVINQARGNTAVSAQMRARVLQVAADLGYRPNFASQSLARKSTRTIGVYIPSGPWTGPGFQYEGMVLRGVEEVCRAQQYDVLILNMGGAVGPQACQNALAQRRVDGVLLLHVEPGSPWIRPLIQSGACIVAVDYAHPEPGLSAMVFDNAAAIRLAVEHLAALGHRRIGFLGSCTDPPSQDAALRQEAFVTCLRQAGLSLRPQWVHDYTNACRAVGREEGVSMLEGTFGARHMLGLPPQERPTALICHGDLVAVHALQVFHEHRLELPRQMSLIGVDDAEMCRHVYPTLTSVRHPLDDMGRRATQILIRKAEARRVRPATSRLAPAVQETFAPTLVCRQSTGPPPATGN